jgi:hypothetical protein
MRSINIFYSLSYLSVVKIASSSGVAQSRHVGIAARETYCKWGARSAPALKQVRRYMLNQLDLFMFHSTTITCSLFSLSYLCLQGYKEAIRPFLRLSNPVFDESLILSFDTCVDFIQSDGITSR